jgi:Tol biopolymer transport system component
MKRTAIAICVVALAAGTVVSAQVTQRVSVSSNGSEANANSYFPSISSDGHYITFYSFADNLVPNDRNEAPDVFVRDLHTGATTRISVDSSGTEGDSDSLIPRISGDGRYIVYQSYADNLVPGIGGGYLNVFVYDQATATTRCASVTASGAGGNWDSLDATISADGRYVAFESRATNLVPNDSNSQWDVFVYDMQTGSMRRASVDPAGNDANNGSYEPSLSADGRYVAFYSYASNLVSGDTNNSPDIFVRDMQTGTITRVSVTSAGMQVSMDDAEAPKISADGRYIAFVSTATALVPGDTNNALDVFLHDMQTGQTTRVSVDSTGVQGNDYSFTPSISADGRFVAFYSLATNLVPGDTNGVTDVFVHDVLTGETSRVSIDSSGAQENGSCLLCSVSGDGRLVAFASGASNLVPGDNSGFFDIFVHDRDSTGFASLCDPGVGGVSPCPCSNAPSGPGRGCDNSASTGGASLSASGAAYLSMDSLVFTTSGEKPTATSILMQGNALAASGLVFGQGVRCVGGTLKRLYTKNAVGGSITAPNFGAGDSTVSARSAMLGDTIWAGQSRYYLVYYRDPIVLGGCPTGSTFNATQTGQVAWSL